MIDPTGVPPLAINIRIEGDDVQGQQLGWRRMLVNVLGTDGSTLR
jgi:hypothetical protein